MDKQIIKTIIGEKQQEIRTVESENDTYSQILSRI